MSYRRIEVWSKYSKRFLGICRNDLDYVLSPEVASMMSRRNLPAFSYWKNWKRSFFTSKGWSRIGKFIFKKIKRLFPELRFRVVVKHGKPGACCVSGLQVAF